MRSRYSAYVRELEDYLLATWHPDTRPASLGLAADPRPKWLSLEVKSHVAQGDQAVVEFAAVYRLGGRACRLQERSRFRRSAGRWFYLDGNDV